MDRNNNPDAQSVYEIQNLFEMVESLKLSLELDFGNLSGILEQWISKIQNYAGNSKSMNETGLKKNTSNLLLITSMFSNLLECLDETKIKANSITNEILDTLTGSFNENNNILEEQKHFDSHNIKLDFVHHDFEIGGLLNGIIHLSHHHFLITGHNSGYINLWGKNSLQLVNQFKAHDSPITCMEYLEKSELLFSGSMDGKVKVYEALNFPMLNHIKTLNFEKKKVVGLLPLIDNSFLLVSCKEGFIHIFDLKSLKLIKTIRKHGPLDQNMVYIKEIKSVAVACLGEGTVELLCPKTFSTLQVIKTKFMVQELKNIQWNPLNKELLVSFAYKIIKAYKFNQANEPNEDRELYIDKPFPSKIDFIDENYMVFASFSDKLDFIKIKDGQPVKSIQVGFTFSDFLLLKDSRKIIIFPYQSSESSIAIVEY